MVFRQGRTGAKPNPRIGDIRIWIEAPQGDFPALIISDRMLVPHEMSLDSGQLLAAISDGAIRPECVSQMSSHSINITVVSQKVVVRCTCPSVLSLHVEHVPRPETS